MKREAGMTLIEVMVALVIFALAGLGGDAVHPAADAPARAYGRENPRQLAGG